MIKVYASLRRIYMIGAMLLMGLGLLCEVILASEWHSVRWVDDGDTVVLADGRRVRYIGINAPEIAHENKPAERLGPQARKFNYKQVYGKNVRLELDRKKYDQYGRLLAYVFLKEGNFVNAEMVKRGYAYYVFRRPNTKYDNHLLLCQREAMARRVGLWQVFRDNKGIFIGNRRSRRFHRATCDYGKETSARNRIIFNSTYSAFWAGYSPCKRCNP